MHAAAAVECALIIDKLFSLSLSGPAHFWAGVLCGRYHSVRKGGGGDGSLIFVKAYGSGYYFLNFNPFLTIFSAPNSPIGRVQFCSDTKINRALPLDPTRLERT
jgi:hypothetical protein